MDYTIMDYMKGFFPKDIKKEFKPVISIPALKEDSHLSIQKNNFIKDMKNKPEEVDICTMTMTCKINTIFITENIGKYIDLHPHNIMEVKYGNSRRTLLYNKEKSPKKEGEKEKDFYNQASLKIITKKDNKLINMKLFQNGSIQMTGCKSVESAYEALHKMFISLNIHKAFLDISNNKIIDIPFVLDYNQLDLNKIFDLNIQMINTNFEMNFIIDREKLYNCLLNDKVDSSYDPIIHAGVVTRYSHPDKVISIFLFEKGSIVITGARNCKQVNDAYIYINKYLLIHTLI